MLSYSRYIEKKLVYIAITALSSRQSSSYAKCTKLNMRLFYNIRSVFNAKCTRPVSLYRHLVSYLIYLMVLGLI